MKNTLLCFCIGCLFCIPGSFPVLSEMTILDDAMEFWGVVVVLLIPVLQKIGIDLDDATGSEVANDLMTIAGAALALYGRVTAKKKISTKSVKTALVGGQK